MEAIQIDYVSRALEFAKEAIADKKNKTNCKNIGYAAQRFIADLKRGKRKAVKFVFDDWYANDACGFIEKLPHIEGEWETKEIVLHPAQIFFIVQLFGFRLKNNKARRRFTSALYATARKSGKSTLCAAILVYCLCCEEEIGAQLISAATTFDQASIIFKIAKQMIEATPDLREHFGLDTFAKSLVRYPTGSSFKPLHAKASTQDGLNPSHVALDEIHAHKSPDLLNVLTSAAGARNNPLWLYVTTEGYANVGPWEDLKKFALGLLRGVFGTAADHFLALIFCIDDNDDEFDQACWIKANPLISVNPNLLDAIKRDAMEAKQMPSKMAEFRTKRLNRPSASADGWINLHHWQKCNGAVDLDLLIDEPCYGGLDLASTGDLTSLRLVWWLDGILYTHGWTWVPESAVRSRSERGTVPYAAWIEQGRLIQTPGDTTDYAFIEKQILEIFKIFNLKEIAYDRWNAIQLVNNLVTENIPLIEFIQGPKSYHPAMQALEIAYMSGKLAHGGDPVLNWCASNVVARRDVNLNMAPDKKKSADKIDEMTALIMAVGISQAPAETPKDYELFFI